MTIQMAGIVANFAVLMVISLTHHSIYNAAAQSLSHESSQYSMCADGTKQITKSGADNDNRKNHLFIVMQ